MIPFIVDNILIITLLSPLFGLFFLLFTPSKYKDSYPDIAFISSAITFILALVTTITYSPDFGVLPAQKFSLISILNFNVLFGMRGFTAVAIPVSTFIYSAVIYLSWGRVTEHKRETYLVVLLLELFTLGFFSSLNLLFTYFFFEASLVMIYYFVLSVRRQSGSCLSRYAGFMVFSSLLYLAVIALLYAASGTLEINKVLYVNLDKKIQLISYILVLVATVCRMGVFPFHGWIREMVGQRIGLSFIFLGIVSAQAIYFLYNMMPVFAFSAGKIQPVLIWFVTISIAISSIIMLTERSSAKLFSYLFIIHSSFAFTGFVAVSRYSISGALLESAMLMLSVTATAFVFDLMARKGNVPSGNKEYRFLLRSFPHFCFMVTILAVSGIPLFYHFPPLFMIWMGLFTNSWVIAFLALASLAIASFTTIRYAGTLFVRGDDSYSGGWIRTNDVLVISPILFFMVLAGIYPDILLKYIKPSINMVWKMLIE